MSHPVHSLGLTRLSLHRLAEHVLAPAMYRATGRIDLRPHPGGIGTLALDPDGRSVAVSLGTLVVRTATHERREWVTTLRAACLLTGVLPGRRLPGYTPSTTCRLDSPLTLETSAMQVLADWYMVGDLALSRVAACLADHPSTQPTLTPQQLHLAMTVGDIELGFSPGDRYLEVPYAYVGTPPHHVVCPINELSSVDDAVAFLLEGLDRSTTAALPSIARRRS